eukprot:CAMPEP_0197191160 /NCGR_PEP_ID=MMETSP1423-20130617/22875_1 /TAXON_ID=476441 /ORGANISM="Pseudo-nitzschia heimii, Strain UNC1101" /LENGTH=1224 /DNA_ID=CAMNT_0042643721 /DNA_START=121 /DNA_END=3795 /DNA_ORIENTATION=+
MTNANRTAKPSSRGPKSWSVTRSPLVPHLAFWTVGILIRLAFPGALKWLAYDNITILLLSVWYPLSATILLIHRDKGRQQLQAFDSLQMERQFWVEYWSVGFAGVQFVHRFVSLVPSLRQMGRHDYPQLPVILSEIKLLYFLWIFAMETLLARYQRFLGVDEQKAHWKFFVPLTFLTKAIGPRLMRVQIAVSEQISKETWQRYIKRKTQKVFELLVMLQFLEVESMHYMLQLLEEGRSLFLLSVFMVLPSSICEVGMLYPQFIFPSARSLVARGETVEILSLKYWVLNSILSLFLSATWWLWWCIPFSNQILLAIRSFATFPTIISYFYRIVEMDLITFGILSGEAELTVKETKTVQALRALVKRLPRDKHAQSFQFEIDDPISEYKNNIDEDSSIGSEDTTESERERRRKRRREKRAKRKLLKQKLSGSSITNTSGRPPQLLSESFVARYASDEDKKRKENNSDNESNEDEGNYSSFINTNEKKVDVNASVRITNTVHSLTNNEAVDHAPKNANENRLFSAQYDKQQENNGMHRDKGYSSSVVNSNQKCESQSNVENVAPKLHALQSLAKDKSVDSANQKSLRSIEKEQRDARNAASKDSASQVEIRHATSFSTLNDDGNEHDRSNPLSQSKTERNEADAISRSLSDETNPLIQPPSNCLMREKEDKDFSPKESNDLTTNDDDSDNRTLLPSTTIGSNYSSSQLQLDTQLTSLSIATPTESIVGEVEVRVKGDSRRSKATTKSKSMTTTLFPVTHPATAGSGLTMPLSFSDDVSTKSSITSLNVLSFRSQSQLSDNQNHDEADSGLYLSDIDTTASSAIGSFEVWSPASNTDQMAPLKEQEQYEDENKTPDTTDRRHSIKSTTKTKNSKVDCNVGSHETPTLLESDGVESAAMSKDTQEQQQHKEQNLTPVSTDERYDITSTTMTKDAKIDSNVGVRELSAVMDMDRTKAATMTKNVKLDAHVDLNGTPASHTMTNDAKIDSNVGLLEMSAIIEMDRTKAATITKDAKVDAHVDLNETTAPPRRSSRLVQLREWQEKKHDEELQRRKKKDILASKGKKSKISIKDNPADMMPIKKSTTEGSSGEPTKAKSKSVSSAMKSKKSKVSSAEKTTKSESSTSTKRKEKSSVASPKRASKTSNTRSPEKRSVASKSTALSTAKRGKKKSLAVSSEQNSLKNKGEESSHNTIGLVESSSPGKTSRKKSKKVPNSRRKKNSVLGSVLGRN